MSDKVKILDGGKHSSLFSQNVNDEIKKVLFNEFTHLHPSLVIQAWVERTKVEPHILASTH